MVESIAIFPVLIMVVLIASSLMVKVLASTVGKQNIAEFLRSNGHSTINTTRTVEINKFSPKSSPGGENFQRADYVSQDKCFSGDIYRTEAMQRSVKYASSLLSNNNSASHRSLNMKDRLAVMILFTAGFGGDTVEMRVRENLLKCCLQRIQAHFTNTSLDIFVWVHNDTSSEEVYAAASSSATRNRGVHHTMESTTPFSKDPYSTVSSLALSSTLSSFPSKNSSKPRHRRTVMYPSWAFPDPNNIRVKYPEYSNVHFMPLEDESWLLPCHLPPRITWTWQHRAKSEGYYQMGRWRLVFAPAFVKELGYRYYFQIDDDTILQSEFPDDIVRRMESTRSLIGVNNEMYSEEYSEVVVGLVEHAKAWLDFRRVTPAGTFWSHVFPAKQANPCPAETETTSTVKSRSTLKPVSNKQVKEERMKFEGMRWDRLYFRGNYMLWDVKFWFRSDVQDFLHFVLVTNKDITQRWQEQGVMNMIRLLFVPEPQLLKLSPRLRHGRKTNHSAVFADWCGRYGITPVYEVAASEY